MSNIITTSELEILDVVSESDRSTETLLDNTSYIDYTSLSLKNQNQSCLFYSKQSLLGYMNSMLKRERETQFFQSSLERLGSKEARNILTISGSILMGRTYLLQEFFKQKTMDISSKNIYIYGDFANSQIGQQDALTFFLEWLCSELKKSILQNYNLPELKDKTKSEKETILKEIATKIRVYLETNSEVLLVLALDRMDRAEIWFPSLENFLSELLNKRFMLMMGSKDRVQIRVDFFAHSRTLELQPFTQFDINFIALAAKLHTTANEPRLKEIGERLLTLSHGLPGLFFNLLEQLNNADCSLDCTLKYLNDQQWEQNLAKFLLDKMLGELRLEEGEKNNYTQILKELSILRRFSISDVHNILTKNPDEAVNQLFGGRTSVYFRDVLRKMRLVRCFDNDSLRGGYSWTENYRLVLEKGTRKWIGEAAYLERQKKAVQLYVDLLKSEQGSEDVRKVYVEELRYHLKITNPELEKALAARLNNQDYTKPLEQQDKEIVESWSIPV